MVNALAVYKVCIVKQNKIKVRFHSTFKQMCWIFLHLKLFWTFWCMCLYQTQPCLLLVCQTAERKQNAWKEYYQHIIWIALYPEEYFILRGFALRGFHSPYKLFSCLLCGHILCNFVPHNCWKSTLRSTQVAEVPTTLISIVLVVVVLIAFVG